MNRLLKLLNFAFRYITGMIDNAFRSLFGVPRLSTSEITPNLYIGGQYQAQKLEHLANWGITGVVNMRTHDTNADFEEYEIEYLQLPVTDQHAPSIEQLQEGVKFITRKINEGGKVYVHCHWGRGRGPTMAAAYLIASGLSLEDTIRLIRKNRLFISLSSVQIQVLREFEEKVRDC